MKPNIEKHTICKTSSVKEALVKLDLNAPSSILFIINQEYELLGSLTDGDLRRGFIKGLNFESDLLEFIQPNPVYIEQGCYDFNLFSEYKKRNLKVVPIVDKDKNIVDIVDFSIISTLIPADALLMAGGEGKRLRPLTENTPKPLLKVGEKPIIEYNIDRLAQCGVKAINLSINYLGEQLINYFGDGSSKGIEINYVKEDKPLGTIGSILLIENFEHDDIIVMNSDLLTNIDFGDFFNTYKESGADMAVAATTYDVDVPYAVLEVENNNKVSSLKEKPRYTYYSNAGIYILNKQLLKMIPKDEFYDITDLMDKLLSKNLHIVTYPINGYWLDIGKHDDYKKAQEDIKHIKL